MKHNLTFLLLLLVGYYTQTAAQICPIAANDSVYFCGGIAASINTRSTDASDGAATGTTSITSPTSSLNYPWSNDETTASVSELAADIYTVIATNQVTDCTASLSLTPQDATCGQANGQIMVSSPVGISSVSWSNGSIANPVVALNAGIYTVTATDTNGCSATQSATVVSSNGIPIQGVATPTSCGNTTDGVASVLVFGGGFIEYLWSNGAIIATIDNLSAGIYTVTVTRHYPTYNCTASTTVVITNAYTPAISVTTTNALCGLALGSAGVIISNAPVGITFTYHWSNGATTTTATGLAPNFGGLAYGVTVTPSTGCNSSQSFDILNTGTPIDVLTGQHPSICGLANGTLTALATSPGTLTWSNGATGSSVPNVAAGTYTVTATNGTCSSTTSIAVVNSPTPIINANINNGTCGLSNGSIAIQPKTHITPTYLWSNGTTTNSIDNLTAGTYTVTVSLGATCSTTSSFTIINPATFSATTTARPTSCDTLTGSVNTIPFSNANLLFNYKWSNAATTQEITNLPAGIYTVTITANNGCTLTQSATILSPISPIAAYFANNPIISQGPQTPLNVLTNMPVNNYVWSNGATSNPITVTPIANTIYTVTVSLATGCSGTASVFVIVNDVKWNIPTVFTPNGDGENDTYYIVQYGSLEVLSFQIYNRWGELLHDKSSKPWDGKKEDVPQPIDTYVYKVIVKYPDSITETRVGDFLLLR